MRVQSNSGWIRGRAVAVHSGREIAVPIAAPPRAPHSVLTGLELTGGIWLADSPMPSLSHRIIAVDRLSFCFYVYLLELPSGASLVNPGHSAPALASFPGIGVVQRFLSPMFSKSSRVRDRSRVVAPIVSHRRTLAVLGRAPRARPSTTAVPPAYWSDMPDPPLSGAGGSCDGRPSFEK